MVILYRIYSALNNYGRSSMLRKTIGLFLLLFSVNILAAPIQIVAAENFYGDLAKTLGGNYVSVISVLKNPNQDPHLFTASPATARAIANADIVIYSGINYDPWMINLLSVDHKKNMHIIIVSALLNKKAGENPHIWYDPKTMPIYADALVKQLIQLDPVHAIYFQQQLNNFTQQDQSLLNLIQKIRATSQGISVVATEPVFNYMATALGLEMHGKSFQLSIMNNTEPSPAAIRDIDDRLKARQVKLLIYNNQVINPATERLKNLAKQMNIPIVGVSETQPEGMSYINWMTTELQKIQNILKIQ